MKEINCPLCHKKMDRLKNYHGTGSEHSLSCTGCEIGLYAYTKENLELIIELWAMPDMESKQARIDYHEKKLQDEAECY